MAQKIIAFSLLLFFLSSPVQARVMMLPPENQDISRFQQQIDFTVTGITTPKVVTYKTPQTLGSFVALKNTTTNEFVPYRQTQVSETNHWTLPISGTSALTDGNARFVQDQNNQTYITFSNQESTTKKLTFDNPGLLMISKLNLTLAPETAQPDSVTVRAILPGESEFTTILNQSPYQNRLTFPQIQPRQIEVLFETENLLRLAELEWTTTNRALHETQHLSFYAAEGDEFTLYIQPNFGQSRVTTFSNHPTQADANTPVFSLPQSKRNPDYNLDFDGDGLFDTQDLCPQVSDSTNADKDKNGIGDACEDPDQDALNSAQDNCPFIPNRQQLDSDKDGLGDLCDDTEDRLSEQSDWWINVSFGIMVMALLFLIGRSAYSASKTKNK